METKTKVQSKVGVKLAVATLALVIGGGLAFAAVPALRAKGPVQHSFMNEQGQLCGPRKAKLRQRCGQNSAGERMYKQAFAMCQGDTKFRSLHDMGAYSNACMAKSEWYKAIESLCQNSCRDVKLGKVPRKYQIHENGMICGGDKYKIRMACVEQQGKQKTYAQAYVACNGADTFTALHETGTYAGQCMTRSNWLDAMKNHCSTQCIEDPRGTRSQKKPKKHTTKTYTTDSSSSASNNYTSSQAATALKENAAGKNKCGVNSFKVQRRCANGDYEHAFVQCYGGEWIAMHDLGSYAGAGCRPSAHWSRSAQAICNGICINPVDQGQREGAIELRMADFNDQQNAKVLHAGERDVIIWRLLANEVTNQGEGRIGELTFNLTTSTEPLDFWIEDAETGQRVSEISSQDDQDILRFRNVNVVVPQGGQKRLNIKMNVPPPEQVVFLPDGFHLRYMLRIGGAIVSPRIAIVEVEPVVTTIDIGGRGFIGRESQLAAFRVSVQGQRSITIQRFKLQVEGNFDVANGYFPTNFKLDRADQFTGQRNPNSLFAGRAIEPYYMTDRNGRRIDQFEVGAILHFDLTGELQGEEGFIEEIPGGDSRAYTLIADTENIRDLRDPNSVAVVQIRVPGNAGLEGHTNGLLWGYTRTANAQRVYTNISDSYVVDSNPVFFE